MNDPHFPICPNCGKGHPPLGRDPEYVPHNLSPFLENALRAPTNTSQKDEDSQERNEEWMD